MRHYPRPMLTIKAFIALLVMWPCASRVAADTAPHMTWAWRTGDDLAWADLSLDETDWSQGATPDPLTLWRSPHRGWYRVHFTLPEETPAGGWGIALGHVFTADEVFLNGTRIGGTGVMGDNYVDALYHRRVYALPADGLRPGTNVLAIRVQSSLAEGGLLGDRVCLGDFAYMSRENELLNQQRHLIEMFFLGILAIAVVFWLLLVILRDHQREFVYLGSLSALFGGIVLLESQLWHDAGLATPFTQRLIMAMILWTPVPIFLFGTLLHDKKIYARIYYAGIVISTTAGLFFLVGGTLRSGHLLTTGWWFMLALSCALLAAHAWRMRAWRQSLIPLTLAAGIVLMLVLALLEVFWPGGAARNPPVGVFLYTGFGVMIAAQALAMALRLRVMNQRLREMSHRMLTAREDTCRRAADALHNELAPTLAATKLELQLVLDRHGLTPSCGPIIEQLSRTIDQARSLSYEMHPAAVDQLGVAVALQTHAERMAAVHNWKLNLSMQPAAGLAGPCALFFFRIGQELLANIAKHARASEVTLRLTQHQNGTQLSVRDNGDGCDLNHTPPGVGWYTLCERTDALQGRCRINAHPGRGMEVTVWIPQT